jgi:glycosyltransferase involved in cell wall biosynthesis
MFSRAHIIPSLSKGGAEKILSKVIEFSDEKCIVLVFQRNDYEVSVNAEVVELFSLKGLNIVFQIVRNGKPISAWLYSSCLIGIFIKFWNSRIPLTLHFRNGRPFKIQHYFILSCIKWITLFNKKNIKCVFNSYSSLRAHSKYVFRCQYDVIHNGVDPKSELNVNRFSDSNLNIVIVALFREEKRYDKMLAVISNFISHTDIIFHIAGPDPGEIRQLAESVSCELENCRLYGRLDEVDFLYETCHLNLLLSDTESLSNVILESAVHGLYNVVSNVGDSHLVVKDSGVLVSSVEEAIDAIKCYNSLPIGTKVHKARLIRKTVELDFDLNRQITKLFRAELCAE